MGGRVGPAVIVGTVPVRGTGWSSGERASWNSVCAVVLLAICTRSYHCGWNIVRDDFARYIAEAANIQSMLQTGKELDSGKEKGADAAMADADQDLDSD